MRDLHKGCGKGMVAQVDDIFALCAEQLEQQEQTRFFPEKGMMSFHTKTSVRDRVTSRPYSLRTVSKSREIGNSQTGQKICVLHFCATLRYWWSSTPDPIDCRLKNSVFGKSFKDAVFYHTIRFVFPLHFCQEK